jgi:hypothetical protein
MSNINTSDGLSSWAKPVGRLEYMARYQSLTGLAPIGPHRPLADKLLKNTTCICFVCKGTGLQETDGKMGRLVCPKCHGLGKTYSITLDELQALRKKIFDQFPFAAQKNWKPGHPIRCPVLNLATGLIIDACPTQDDDSSVNKYRS